MSPVWETGATMMRNPGSAMPLVLPVQMLCWRERRTALHRYLLIGLGGALGSIARYWVGSAIGSRMGIRFPFGTLVVNLTACVIIGFALTLLGKRVEIDPTWRYFATIGFIGAYSTFSTF